ncbi:hypothetical protein ACFO5R_03345 [Halosolutus amylolyticus]|uniref:Restriction endonuclease n=1 Tax=Halosolutus amylolyticus TaxID=2932267 RepID=A0ABD5PKL5_9EURY|nr:hypothetical protein [Halosolutus amylolyticus]
MVDSSHPLDRLRQPEYTGENRCIPCTIVNVVIAAVLSAVIALLSPPAAPIVLAVSLAAIYFRGYLVPGTPTLTKRYFPDWLLAKFDKAPEPGGPAVETRETGTDGDAPTDEFEPVDPETYFLDHGVVTPCTTPDGEEDLCLDDGLRTAWRAAIEEMRDADRRSQVADFLETDSEVLSLDVSGGNVVARIDGQLAAQWESDAALVADLASSRVLEDRLPDWEARPLEQRSQLASGLRAFVERCPTCDGPISIDAETVESCCRSHEVYAITCDDCEVRVLEVQQ